MSNYIFNFFSDNYLVRENFFKPLRILNNVRFEYILKRINVSGKFVLDVGCGDGLLTEKICMHGGIVTGIDKSNVLISSAIKSAFLKKINIRYLIGDLFSVKISNKFDIIICTEVLEHLHNKQYLFDFFFNLSKPGTLIFISSLDNNLLSYFKIIFLGEFISNKIVKNTHKSSLFSGLFDLSLNFKKYAFSLNNVKYLNYNFFLNYANLHTTYKVNYLVEILRTQ